ncbi:helix-turn-helix domain-containing protein [Synechococcus sp. CCY9201]|uniref:helix-turn-helix domain-containing protein n=1 Tax=Synechococcus sp. CCY9201 TaxID=174697 RepID=UPI002B2155EB|nr:helix-turn-helix domain-containing protein [Synechococcus sp. CCY9201]MEA5474461.1 helix-turn-helix domain-containing protein [Synechococcus sp. CCY9201]
MRGQLALRRLGPLRLMRLQLNRRLHVAGPKPADQQVLALDLTQSPGPSLTPLRAHGVAVGPDMLFGLDVRSDVHLSTPEVLDLGVILLQPSRLKRCSTDLGWADIEATGLASNCLAISPERHRRLRGFLLALLTSPVPPPEGLSRDLLPLVLEAMVQGSSCQASLLPAPTRLELVKQAQQWVREHPQEPITLDALCRQLHAGRRSLLQGFQEHLGMGPMAYIKLHRLHGIRRELLTADPRAVTIGGLALRWGFLNAGHFARDYRRLFGELPSQTLAGGG